MGKNVASPSICLQKLKKKFLSVSLSPLLTSFLNGSLILCFFVFGVIAMFWWASFFCREGFSLKFKKFGKVLRRKKLKRSILPLRFTPMWENINIYHVNWTLTDITRFIFSNKHSVIFESINIFFVLLQHAVKLFATSFCTVPIKKCNW